MIQITCWVFKKNDYICANILHDNGHILSSLIKMGYIKFNSQTLLHRNTFLLSTAEMHFIYSK